MRQEDEEEGRKEGRKEGRTEDGECTKKPEPQSNDMGKKTVEREGSG